MKITVLGAGTWGTALTILLSSNGHEVKLWSAVEKEINAMKADRKKIRNLPGAVMPENVLLTTELNEALEDAPDIIVMATASIFVRSTAAVISPFIRPGQIIVNVAKGIEEYRKMTNGSLLIITHTTKILEGLNVDHTHVLVKGHIVKTGDGHLFQEINEKGFEGFLS